MRNSGDRCVIPEIALEDDRSSQHLRRAFASSCETKWMQRLWAGNFGAVSPLLAPPSAVPAATAPSQVDREDLGHVAFTELGFPLFVILNSFQDNIRRLFAILKQVQDDERGVGMTVGVL